MTFKVQLIDALLASDVQKIDAQEVDDCRDCRGYFLFDTYDQDGYEYEMRVPYQEIEVDEMGYATMKTLKDGDVRIELYKLTPLGEEHVLGGK